MASQIALCILNEVLVLFKDTIYGLCSKAGFIGYKEFSAAVLGQSDA